MEKLILKQGKPTRDTIAVRLEREVSENVEKIMSLTGFSKTELVSSLVRFALNHTVIETNGIDGTELFKLVKTRGIKENQYGLTISSNDEEV